MLVLVGQFFGVAILALRPWALLMGLLSIVVATSITFSGDSRLFLLAAPSLITLALMGIFANSLRPERTALISLIAEAIRGPLPAEVARYTRQITWLWVGVFAFIALVNAALAIFASAAVWSWFANVLSYVLLFGVMVGEWLYRQRRLRGLESLSARQYFLALVRVDYQRLFRS